MTCLNKSIGSLGEDMAAEYLKDKGYIILYRNFRCRTGEIDIIARDGCYIAFIEVKARYGSQYGLPRESVNYKKKLKLYNTAAYYLTRNNLHNSFLRFDVVEVNFNSEDDSYSIELMKDAFQL